MGKILDQQARLTEMLKLLSSGATKEQLVLYARKKWKLSTRQATRWMALTYATAAKNAAKGEPMAAVVEGMLREIIQGAIRDHNWSAARAAVVDLARFKGFFIPGEAGDTTIQVGTINQQNNINLEGPPPTRTLAPIEKRAELDALEQRRSQWLKTTTEHPPAPTTTPASTASSSAGQPALPPAALSGSATEE